MAVATITVSSNSPFFKGQKMSEGNCGVFDYPKKQQIFFLISALAKLKNCQNSTFEPVHEIQFFFWPIAFF